MRTLGQPRIAAVGLPLLLLAGCGFDPGWPAGPLREHVDDGAIVRAYRINGTEKPNYFQRIEGGRVVSLHFDDNGDGRYDETVDRRRDDPRWPHCVLVLDGVAFDVVAEMHAAGHFRLFPPPSRLITVFPAMTDLALTKIFESPPAEAAEALYYDARQGRLVGGNIAYLRGANAPWLARANYHAPQDIGAKAYLSPQEVFDQEMRGTLDAFQRATTGTVTAYSIGSAGLGTRGGRPAMRRYLLAVEKLYERIVYEKRGRVRISLMADHGHTLVPCRRRRFSHALKAAGYRLNDSVRGPKDVASPEYGVVNYAAFSTREPAGVAAALLADLAVDLAIYKRGDAVIVRARGAEAEVRRVGERYSYRAQRGDPLRLFPVISRLRAEGGIAADGTIDDRALFQATAEHDYPDPLHRIWQYFHGLVRQPADLVVSLRPEYCHGSWMFEFAIGGMTSTHGGLERASATAFVLSDVGTLPAAIRIDEVMHVLRTARRAALGGATTSRAGQPED